MCDKLNAFNYIFRWSTMTKREQAARLTVGLMKKGLSIPEIEVEVAKKTNVYGTYFRQKVLKDAYDAFEKMETTEKQKMYDLHMNRYERHYKHARKTLQNLSQEYDGDEYEKWMSAMNTALNALKGKENMMGFHESGFSITLNDNEMIIHNTTQGQYSKLHHQINKLDFEEMLELRELLKDSRMKEVDGVWPTRKVERDDNVQDIQYVEVTEEETDDLPEPVIKEMQKEVDLEPTDQTSPEILDNITKALQKKSQEQLLKALAKKKEKKVEKKVEPKTTKIVKPKKKKK